MVSQSGVYRRARKRTKQNVASAGFDATTIRRAKLGALSNAFYDPGEQRAAKVHALFGSIARRYDLINDVQSFGMHRRWKRRVVALADVKPGVRALDVCCGTGDLAFALAAHGAEVTGLDFNEPMLAVAKAKVQSLKSKVQSPEPGDRSVTPHSALRTPRFIHGDAMQLPFPDESFDLVTVGYGLRNLARWETGLAEMARVARPGGRLLVLDFGKPDNALWRAIYFGYLRLIVPIFGLLFARRADAYAYILESLKHYSAQRGVAAKMRHLGLENVRVINFLGGAMSINLGDKPSPS
jgi:demethylmenaquinone methyltransferase/2-methoxy-6-polyprenyl-1,4-benzoquinol methylase